MSDPLIHVKNVKYNATTGHREFSAFVVETSEDGLTEVHGSPETHGIDPLSLEGLYGGAGGTLDEWVMRWREDVKRRMLENHRIRLMVETELLKMVGQRY
jgi:hypothetical protein